MSVRFHFQAKATLLQRKQLKSFIEEIFSKEKRQLKELDYVFCDNNYLLDINRKYLQHDFYTDIISFDLSDPKFEGISGEIYISVDMIRSNSIKYKSGFSTELLRVIFHGALHLCGYKDKTSSEKILMTKKEDHYLKLFHVKHG